MALVALLSTSYPCPCPFFKLGVADCLRIIGNIPQPIPDDRMGGPRLVVNAMMSSAETFRRS